MVGDVWVVGGSLVGDGWVGGWWVVESVWGEPTNPGSGACAAHRTDIFTRFFFLNTIFLLSCDYCEYDSIFTRICLSLFVLFVVSGDGNNGSVCSIRLIWSFLFVVFLCVCA